MADQDARSREEEYFWKKDQELIEKMRRQAAAERAHREMSAQAGIEDPEVIEELQALGFTPDTVVLLPLVPLVKMAWVEGGVSDVERQLIVQFARSRGIGEGTPADAQLSAWLAKQPDAEVFTRAMRLVRAVLAAPGASTAVGPDEIVAYCENIAAASGGILGMRKISAAERTLLTSIADSLKGRER